MLNLHSLTSYFLKKYPSFIQAVGWNEEDLYQEIYLILTEKDVDIDADKNLAITLIKNALIDKSRKHVRRWQSPCASCPIGASLKKGKVCVRFREKMTCPLFNKFSRKELSRPNIANCTIFSQAEGVENGVKMSSGEFYGRIEFADSYRKIHELCIKYLEGEERDMFLEWEAAKKEPSKQLVAIIRRLIEREMPHVNLSDSEMII